MDADALKVLYKNRRPTCVGSFRRQEGFSLHVCLQIPARVLNRASGDDDCERALTLVLLLLSFCHCLPWPGGGSFLRVYVPLDKLPESEAERQAEPRFSPEDVASETEDEAFGLVIRRKWESPPRLQLLSLSLRDVHGGSLSTG